MEIVIPPRPATKLIVKKEAEHDDLVEGQNYFIPINFGYMLATYEGTGFSFNRNPNLNKRFKNIYQFRTVSEGSVHTYDTTKSIYVPL